MCKTEVELSESYLGNDIEIYLPGGKKTQITFLYFLFLIYILCPEVKKKKKSRYIRAKEEIHIPPWFWFVLWYNIPKLLPTCRSFLHALTKETTLHNLHLYITWVWENHFFSELATAVFPILITVKSILNDSPLIV